MSTVTGRPAAVYLGAMMRHPSGLDAGRVCRDARRASSSGACLRRLTLAASGLRRRDAIRAAGRPRNAAPRTPRAARRPRGPRAAPESHRDAGAA